MTDDSTDPGEDAIDTGADEIDTGAETSDAAGEVAEPEADGEPDPVRPRWYRRFATWWHRDITAFSYAGAITATAFFWLSATPSLLPRGAFFQGVVSGAAAAIGYGVGTFFAWLARYLVSRPTAWPRPPRWAWAALGTIAVAGTAVMFYWYIHWQNQIRDLMSVDRLGWGAAPVVVLVAAFVFALLIVIGQLWGAAVRSLTSRINRRVPRRISAIASVTLMVVLSIFIVNGVVANYGMRALNSSFAALNDETNPDSDPPLSTLRSGGPESLMSWASLGRLGRSFVSTGPTRQDIAEFTGRPADDPIRAYAGLDQNSNPRATADLVVREMQRTGAFERKLIGIGSSTGTGWINQATVDSLEYMYGGDTTMVSMQYSTLPSWLSFLVDQQRARNAGIALFEAVDKVVRSIPEAQRPLVVVFGESLGSFGGESPFGSVPTLSARTDGALFVGPTFSNTLWKETTANRDSGSPEWLPEYQNGEMVRFISGKQDLRRRLGPWDHGRIVYLQHASDPISWWSPELVLNKPDWLSEPRGPDVLDSVQWIPIVTFLQVAADLAVAADVPDGHGHHYLEAIPWAWQAILEPPDWTDADTERLVPLLHRD